MPQGPVVTAEVEALIAQVYRENPKWKGPKIRNEVRIRLQDPKLRQELRLPSVLPFEWPSLYRVQQSLAEIRKREREPKEEDKPWTIFTLAEHPISPEALPKVLKQYREVKDFYGLSIREAKWIARLSAIDPPERWPWLYALVASIEQLFEMIGSPPSFHLIDDILAASAAKDREVENELLDRLFEWFGTEAISLYLEQVKSRNSKKNKGGTK